MGTQFEADLERYADLAIQIGLNLQPGQRLVIGDPRRAGIPIEIAPLARALTRSAYRAGARYVDVIFRDDAIQRIRFEEAPRDSFDLWPEWQAKGLAEHVRRGDALISVHAANPDLLNDQDPDLVALTQKTAWSHFMPVSEVTSRNLVNWLVIAASYAGWAAKVFPDVPASEREMRLWQALFRVCRVDQPDPIAAWKEHVRQLVARSDYLNHKQYARLHYRGPGTDVTVGLPQGHQWHAARSRTPSGIDFTANLPTEEVFTLPHAGEVDGTVAATKPLNYGDALIDGFRVRFERGRVVEASATQGEAVLRKMLETDDGARSLGEVALVPHSSPISQSGIMFYNTLLDENCASHFAFGRAYKFTMDGGETLSDEAFIAAGGNMSLIHVDFMVGSGQVDIDGVDQAGHIEPVMRQGEWAFAV